MQSKKPTPPAAPEDTRLVAYYRYSGGSGQTDQSIEGQRRDCEAWAKAHGLVILDEYVDRAISGTTDDRPQFQRMVKDSDRHKFNAVICWKTDRISRNRYDSAVYKKRLRDNGVKLYYAAESIPDGPEAIILEALMEGLAEYYSAELSQKLRRGIRESAMKCQTFGGPYPLGLKSVNKHYAIDESKAPIVRWIFEEYAKGTSAADIMAQLNANGIRTVMGNQFTRSAIVRMIQNEKYVGVYDSHGNRVEDAIPAIIDRPLWDAAQARLALNQRTRRSLSNRSSYALTGKCTCGLCGNTLNGKSGNGHGGKYHYYTCNGRANKTGCTLPSIRADLLEPQVLHSTCAQLLAPDRLQSIAKQVIDAQLAALNAECPEQEMLEKALAENERKQNNLLNLMEQGTAPRAMVQRLTELENAASQLRYKLDNLRPKIPDFTAEHLEFMLRSFCRQGTETTESYKTRLFDSFISNVTLYPNTAVITYSLQKETGAPESTPVSLKNCHGSQYDILGGASESTNEPKIIVTATFIQLFIPLIRS